MFNSKSIVIAKLFSYEKTPIFHGKLREILTNGGECDIMITVKIPMAEKSAITILLELNIPQKGGLVKWACLVN